MAGLGFFDEQIQLSGIGVRCNFLIPQRFAVFQQPISHSMNILGFKLCNCRFSSFQFTAPAAGATAFYRVLAY